MRIVILAIFVSLLSACGTSYPNQSVKGQVFPSITGQTLEQNQLNIPADLKQDAVLLLIGYKQNSQFDIDRWLIGLDMTNTIVDVYELPTIQGMFPRMFSTVIDNGMRKGIPKELWKGVVTVYEDGEKVQKFTGNESGNNARVALINKDGVILYFYDRGFSVGALNELRNALEATR
ncbi:hypothetical protein GCM10008107_29130 [Psychrosphaera saromensis]|uniref:Lipoprotein n=1 Tax=Psychrosphaera saromensis TaxID=716813 RepID=A0A2S7USH1_9GAMM|nr:hypothetical protein [Psychrosphaera saromensis]PQJ52944.1 hypothetical protein BTO11_04265 [Psychrosphaera saromensis]GHB77716.1 hypothetical protein GCM10008107_29130 [Psychrosphaera saromensis]GLQ12898.1 hypothetical protein GCM10007917_03530 [Psychrosphaera saromensis]